MCPNCKKGFKGSKSKKAIAFQSNSETCGYLRASFLDRMQAELEANAIKGDWEALVYDYSQASRELMQHAAKLMLSVRAGDRAKVSEHAADVAVIAMKISETYGEA